MARPEREIDAAAYELDRLASGLRSGARDAATTVSKLKDLVSELHSLADKVKRLEQDAEDGGID